MRLIPLMTARTADPAATASALPSKAAYEEKVASWGLDEERAPIPFGTCLACGAKLEESLRFTASLRCAECRDEEAPLDPRLVAAWQSLRAS